MIECFRRTKTFYEKYFTQFFEEKKVCNECNLPGRERERERERGGSLPCNEPSMTASEERG